MAIDIPREIALKILYDINEKGAYSNIALNRYFEGYELRDVDKAFITDLVYGTIKWRLSIDWIIGKFSSVKIRKMSPWICNILRLGIYQLIYTDKVPQSAACNESVNLSKRYGHKASSNFVNAVLRNIARNKDNIEYPDRKKDIINYLSIKYSHPEWMVKEWLQRFGSEFTESLLLTNNEVADFSVRTNTLKITRQHLIEEFGKIGVEAQEGKYSEEAVIIKNPSSISKMDIFKKGYFQVQDESSMLVTRVLDPKPEDYVIDVCSAPGGKATHIAQHMGNKGVVVARDIHEHKIKIINDAAKRLGLTIVKAEIFDALVQDNNNIEKADKVLVDAPCTGLGIIRRKPDIKWTRNVNDTDEIKELQTKILSTASKYLKPGGTLVYSTCTIQKEENEDIVKNFIKDNPDFYLVDFSPLLPANLQKPSAKDGYMQLFPNIDDIDGFFIAKIMKRG